MSRTILQKFACTPSTTYDTDVNVSMYSTRRAGSHRYEYLVLLYSRHCPLGALLMFYAYEAPNNLKKIEEKILYKYCTCNRVERGIDCICFSRLVVEWLESRVCTICKVAAVR